MMDHGSKKRWETVVGKGQYKGNEKNDRKINSFTTKKKRIIINIVYKNIPSMLVLYVKNKYPFLIRKVCFLVSSSVFWSKGF